VRVWIWISLDGTRRKQQEEGVVGICASGVQVTVTWQETSDHTLTTPQRHGM